MIILERKKSNVDGLEVGIVDTPCYPARYYAGYLHNGVIWSNATENFYRSLEEAKEKFEKMN